MSKLLKPFNKVMGAIGLIDYDEDEIAETEEDEEEEEQYEEPEIINNKKNKIVSIKTNSNPKVQLKKPREFQEIMEVVDSVKSRRIVVINLLDVEQKMAQRMIDYLVGACYALNGSFEEISKSIYLVAPESVDVNSDMKQELNDTSFFSFQER